MATLFVVVTLKPEWLPRSGLGGVLPSPTVFVAAPAPAGSAAGPAGMAAAARAAAPAVVSIVTSKAPRFNPHAGDPRFEPFLGPRGSEPQTGLGSGVIVSPEGYLLTNHHVVEGADEIEVLLPDGRQLQARVVGTDPETDLAVLKVQAERLSVITFGQSAELHVGEPVLAIGNPFNVGQTVTAGIVSALGRNQLGLSTFENFIQTDAAINPGNSGGALVNAAGQLVGINTAIFSRSGGSMGIGFAIPADTAREVMEALIQDGRVTRGWIGVEARDMSPEFAESFGLPVTQGALVTGVLQGGAADRAGIRPGDVVVMIDDAPVANMAQMLARVAALRPGTEVSFKVQRGTQALSLRTVVAQRPVPAERGR